MDTKTIEEISAKIEAIAKDYPHMRLYVLIGQPCAAHNGAHLDLASCGASELVELMDDAIASLKGVTERPLPMLVN